ncbi:hypothetical protein HED35_04350 [Vagococcus fluvialis]|uniref:ABC transporter permease n=2 Tax=Vagococcus fluvialis TaxID=2738 RepID=A0A7X6D7U9_9ENTE|nr:hypothetical protein [Vagococcus fluvialis]
MKEEFRRAVKRPLNILFMLLGCLLMSILFTYVHTDKYQTFELKNKSEALQVTASLLSFQVVNSDEGTPVYQNLLLQKSILARQLNSVLFEQPKKYIETGQELNQLRLEIRKEKDFTDSIKILQPNITETLKEEAFYNHLIDNKQEVILKPETFGSLTLLFLTILGVVWFPICAFLTANVLEDEYEHSSLVKGQPKTFMKRMLTKISVLYIFFVISFTAALGVSFLLTQILGNPMNDLNQVNVIQLVNFSILANWKIIGLYFVYLSILFVFVFILSVFLNIIVKNFYLTLIIELIIYALTILLPGFISQAPWYLGSFIIPSYLFNGHYLTDTTTLLNPVFGAVYLVVASVILGFLTSLISKRGLKGVRG